MPDRFDTDGRYGPPEPAPRYPAAVLALLPLVALLLAAGVGLLTGWLLYTAAKSTAQDGWAQLGAFLLALAVGAGAAGLTWVAGVVGGAFYAFPPGKRALPATIAIGLPVAIEILVLAVSRATPVTLWSPVYAFAAIAAIAAGPAAFAWSARPRGRRRIAVCAAAVALAVVGGAVGSGVWAKADARQAGKELPLVLLSGRSIDSPYPGWRRDAFSGTAVSDGTGPLPGVREAYLKYFTGEGVMFITMHASAGSCVNTSVYRCTVVSDTDRGQLRRYDRVASYGSYPRGARIDMLVFPDGKAVSAQGPDTSTGQPARQGPTSADVLDDVMRVSQRSFETATRAPLRTR